MGAMMIRKKMMTSFARIAIDFQLVVSAKRLRLRKPKKETQCYTQAEKAVKNCGLRISRRPNHTWNQ
jgi:hypothetical protein